MDWLRAFAGTGDERWWRLVKLAGGISLLMHVVAAATQDGIHHCDEHFQIIEWMAVLQGRVDAHLLAWEHGAHIRSWLQPAFYFVLVAPLRALGLENPFHQVACLRMTSSLMAWASLMMLVIACRHWFDEAHRRGAVVALLFSHVTYVHARTSSENLSQTFLVVALALLAVRLTPRLLFVVGALFAVAFGLRFQVGFAIAGAGLWVFVHVEKRVRSVAAMAAGFFVVFAGVVAVDRVGYGEWTLASWNYLSDQVLHSGAAKFGETPWWDYVPQWWRRVGGPFGPAVLLGGIAAALKWRRHPLAWAVLPFIAGHLLVGHKEGRFLFPVLLPMLVLIGASLSPRFFDVTGWRELRGSARLVPAIAVAFVLVDVVTWLRAPLILKPVQMEILDDLYPLLREEPRLYTLSADPYVDCGLQMNFYRPGELNVETVSSVDGVLARQPAAYVHRETIGVPVDDPIDGRCTRITSSQGWYVPVELAAKDWVKPLYAQHRLHEVYRCNRR